MESTLLLVKVLTKIGMSVALFVIRMVLFTQLVMLKYLMSAMGVKTSWVRIS